jgi:hypothetical protein
MDTKPKVKVIKKGEVREQAKPAYQEQKSKRAAARDMVTNVTGWVNDFQSRKRVETKLAIEQLFNAQPRPSEG